MPEVSKTDHLVELKKDLNDSIGKMIDNLVVAAIGAANKTCCIPAKRPQRKWQPFSALKML